MTTTLLRVKTINMAPHRMAITPRLKQTITLLSTKLTPYLHHTNKETQLKIKISGEHSRSQISTTQLKAKLNHEDKLNQIHITEINVNLNCVRSPSNSCSRNLNHTSKPPPCPVNTLGAGVTKLNIQMSLESLILAAGDIDVVVEEGEGEGEISLDP
jgi:hypothetical protein